MELERRILNTGLRAVRAKGDNGRPMLVGRAVPYGSRSEDLGGFIEVFEGGPGAVSESLYAAPHHDPRQIIGRASAGTLRVEMREDGLDFEVDLPDTGPARDLLELVERGDISGNSFTFSLLSDDAETWEPLDDGIHLRTIRAGKWKLWEVAPGVVEPAYRSTDVEVARRSLEMARRSTAAVVAKDHALWTHLRGRRF